MDPVAQPQSIAAKSRQTLAAGDSPLGGGASVKHAPAPPPPFAHAMAFATAWLHTQSDAHAASCVEHPRHIQSQQPANAGTGCQDTAGHPLSPAIPTMGGRVEPAVPELVEGVEPSGKGSDDAMSSSPVAAASSPAPASEKALVRPPHAAARATVASPESRLRICNCMRPPYKQPVGTSVGKPAQLEHVRGSESPRPESGHWAKRATRV
jgi:hypothetical protein